MMFVRVDIIYIVALPYEAFHMGTVTRLKALPGPIANAVIAASQAALAVRRCCKRATSATPAEHNAR